MSSPPYSPLVPSSGPGRRSRWRALHGFGLLAVLLHLALLGAAGGGRDRDERAAPTAAPLIVRTLEADARQARPEAPSPSAVGDTDRTAPLALEQEPDLAAQSTAKAAKKASTRSHAKLVEKAVAEPAVEVADPGGGSREAAPAFATAEVATAESTAEDPGSAPGMMKVALAEPRAAAVASFLGAGERAPPTYRTVLPGPATLRYELRRGMFRGTGEIRWRPAAGRYALQFEAKLAGLSLLAQSSQGDLDANGLSPVRFIDQRARKSARSVNFSRDTGTISFSGSSARWPLLAGSQDRLSWMIQLGGIVAADPALATSGRISMVLVSARGEAGVRSARFAGRENAETASGNVPALKFVVDGHSAYDGSFEIWLDPAHGYLPARAVSRSSAGEAEFELLLQRADP